MAKESGTSLLYIRHWQGTGFVSCGFVWMFALLRAQNRIVHSQPASLASQRNRQTDGQGRHRGRDRALQAEDRSGKVAHGADGVTACLSRRLLSARTHSPGINTAVTDF